MGVAAAPLRTRAGSPQLVRAGTASWGHSRACSPAPRYWQPHWARSPWCRSSRCFECSAAAGRPQPRPSPWCSSRRRHMSTGSLTRASFTESARRRGGRHHGCSAEQSSRAVSGEPTPFRTAVAAAAASSRSVMSLSTTYVTWRIGGPLAVSYSCAASHGRSVPGAPVRFAALIATALTSAWSRPTSGIRPRPGVRRTLRGPFPIPSPPGTS